MKPRVSQLDIAGTPDGTKFLRDDATWAVPAGGGGGFASVPQLGARTATDLTMSLTSTWAEIDSTNFRKTVAAATGDILEFAVGMLIESTANYARFDAATVVSGTRTNHFGNSGLGHPAWTVPNNSETQLTGSVFYVVQAGDIVAGDVSVGFFGRADTTATKKLFSGSTFIPRVMLRNCGQ